MDHMVFRLHHHGRFAFTLIETIAAIVILAMAVPPMMFALRQATVDRIDPIRFSQARWLATEWLEDILADRHSATRGYDYIIEANYPHETSVASNPAFGRQVRIFETGADLRTPGAGYKTVTVVLTWADSKGRSRSLEVATVLTELEP